VLALFEEAHLAGSPYYHYLKREDNFRKGVELLERGSITASPPTPAGRILSDELKRRIRESLQGSVEE
jgi:hypothetical protein